jgi:Fungal chitosanase of glycosyl hydrolase group 75
LHFMCGVKKIPALLAALMLPGFSITQSAQAPMPNAQSSADSCPVKSLLLDFDVHRFGAVVGQLPIWRLGEEDSAFFFSAGMAIDADGAPNAYNSENTGLDDLSNAGQPGRWDGILQDRDGNPLVQGPDDPFPGYYISCTALADWTKDHLDPTRFVDASKIPYIALPGDLARATGARLGDVATVFNMRNGKFSHAIFADIGALGEGSIALADNLGIWSDARAGGAWGGIVYVVFPGSGDHQPKSVEEINDIAAKLFHDWGGIERVRSCADPGDWRHRSRPAFPPPWDPQAMQAPRITAPEPKPSADSAAATTRNATTN